MLFDGEVGELNMYEYKDFAKWLQAPVQYL